MKYLNLLRPKVQCEYLVRVDEEESIDLVLHFLEVKLHANLLENLNVLEHHAVSLHPLVVFIISLGIYVLENEELVLLLFVLDEILATDDGQVAFTV